jgi:hypothetical protein
VRLTRSQHSPASSRQDAMAKQFSARPGHFVGRGSFSTATEDVPIFRRRPLHPGKPYLSRNVIINGLLFCADGAVGSRGPWPKLHGLLTTASPQLLAFLHGCLFRGQLPCKFPTRRTNCGSVQTTGRHFAGSFHLQLQTYFDQKIISLKATAVWYLVFYSPFDIVYKLAKFTPFKVLLSVMKECQRVYKVPSFLKFLLRHP